MELIGLSLLLISLVLLINRPKSTKEFEPKSKVNIGNGIETVSWSRLHNLTELEKDYIFKNAKQCTHISVDLPDFDTESVIKITDCFRS